MRGFLDFHVNSIAVYVCRLPVCWSAQDDGCGAQTNPTPDLTLTLSLTLPLTPPSGALGLLSRSAGAVLSLRAYLKTLHVRAIKRLVVFFI